MSRRHDIRGIDHDAGYVLDEEFEELSAGSSDGEDELDVLLHGTPNQKRRLIRHALSGDEGESSESEDDFEKQMNKELDDGMTSKETEMLQMFEQQMASTSATGGQGPGQGSGQGSVAGGKTAAAGKATQQTVADEFYNDIYFDSDEDSDNEQPQDVSHGVKGHDVKSQEANLGSDGQSMAQSDVTDESTDSEAVGADGKGKKRRKKHRVMTNDELFYDPNMDADDEKWMTRQREKYRAINEQKASSGAGPSAGKPKAQPAPNSDAILNCPACMTTLCIDCQRHDLYQTQYRAMFVLNCNVIRAERLRYPKKNRGSKKQKKGVERLEAAEPGADGDDIYHPVKCGVCSTEVAVYDKEEIFHFFNVLASHS
ncbi:PREDICTED: E2F-associated phosphoprotein-like [Branchiostoma belcheri]|uniref:E2F-associated phosphoprotein-like n=1 Tax=Branchiostoma belcheri TaxID=7741 RepID=A0A6P4XU35_BRABE|nr:PREDICTED: E2F-associated phosphoprotein-like [Branchiostoma belcheri]